MSTENETLAVIQNEIGHIKRKIDEHMDWEEKNNERNTTSLERQEMKLIEMIKELDERKADKITQTIVFALVGIILAGVVTALVSLVITK